MENSFSYQPAAGRYERMPYKYCGKSGLQLPLISLGCGTTSVVWTISMWQPT